jgi:hypothetical protein
MILFKVSYRIKFDEAQGEDIPAHYEHVVQKVVAKDFGEAEMKIINSVKDVIEVVVLEIKRLEEILV